MRPFYLQAPEGDLFAVYHEPRSGSTRESAVLLCYPLGHEYLNSHRAYRQIAVMLSEAGFPVLRFDYLGSGDSGGSCEQASIELWLRNVEHALVEVKARSGAEKVCLAGLRLGASLALLAAHRTGSVDALVLWDPVLKGDGYLQELEILHRRVLETAEGVSRTLIRPRTYDGVSLFGFGMQFRREVGALDLFSAGQKPAERVLLLDSGAEPKAGPLKHRLRGQGSTVDHKHMPVDGAWRNDFDSLFLPGPALPAVVRWVSEVCA
jgi:pimeloyl-ACP methyl ester carboxylesterase